MSRIKSPLHRTLVSSAGPASNTLVGILLCIWITLMYKVAPPDCFYIPYPSNSPSPRHNAFSPTWRIIRCITTCAYLQFQASFINLFPLPGLDGWGVVSPWLPLSITRLADWPQASLISFIIVLVYFIFVERKLQLTICYTRRMLRIFGVPRNQLSGALVELPTLDNLFS